MINQGGVGRGERGRRSDVAVGFARYRYFARMAGNRLALLALLLLVVCASVVVVAVRRRRRAARLDDRQAGLDSARKAIRQSARETRKRRRGSLRGKGGGGDQNLASDAGSTSDSGGTP